jgi:hypothetical protein
VPENYQTVSLGTSVNRLSAGDHARGEEEQEARFTTFDTPHGPLIPQYSD